MTKLELEIMFLCLRPHLHFLDMDDGLFLFRIMGLFALLVFKLSIVHDSADRRFRFRRNLHQIKFKIGSQPKCL